MKPIDQIIFGAIHEDRGAFANGVNLIVASNSSRFEDGTPNEALTSYVVGYRDKTNIQLALETMFPLVPSPKRFNFAAATNGEFFLSEDDDIRAIGGEFKKLQPSKNRIDSSTLNKGLTICVDHDDVEGMVDWEQMYAAAIKRRLMMNELRRGLAVLDAAANNTAKTWTSGTPVPDSDVEDMIERSGTSMGMDPNLVVYGSTAWLARKRSARAQKDALAAVIARYNEQDLAAEVGVDAVYRLRHRFQTTPSGTKTVAGAAKVYAYFAEQEATKEDPSAVKRFVSGARGGDPFAVYVERKAKRTEITVEHYSRIVATGLGIESLTIS